jgi:hypothetical protein
MLRFLIPRTRHVPPAPAGRRSRTFALGLFLGVVAVRLYQTVPPPQLPMPPDEAAFIRAVTAARLADLEAPNDLARLDLRAQRAAAICAAIPTLTLDNWTGRLTGAEPNTLPDLLGQTTIHLTITLAPHVTLQTPSSPLTNLPSNMLVRDNPLAATAATIPLNHAITISGMLPPSPTDCATEISGGLTDPSFKLELSGLGAIGASGK